MAGGSAVAVYAALGANSVVTVAKLGGFFLTGSGAMLSEGLHSLADVGNQALLAVGMRKADRPPDDKHPFGYGREAFVWSLISAVGMFFLGCGVSLAHGIESLLEDHGHIDGGMLNLGILLFALVLEGGSMSVAVWALRGEARANGQSFRDYLRNTEDPFGVAVLLEDGAAVLGVLIALVAVGLSTWTHNPKWDAAGTLAVAALMGAIAFWLIRKNRSMLVGMTVPASGRDAFVAQLNAEAVVAHVVDHRSEVTGADTWTLTAQVRFSGPALNDAELRPGDLDDARAAADGSELRHWLDRYADRLTHRLAQEVDGIEARVRHRLPKARTIHIEPD